MLARRGSAAKNQLLNLAFEDSGGSSSLLLPPPPEQGYVRGKEKQQPKGVPNAIFAQATREHALLLGMVFPRDEKLLWIAEESLLAPLPEGWVQMRDETSGHPYYYNQGSGESSWEHPRDGFYRQLYEQKKCAEQPGYGSGTTIPVTPAPVSQVSESGWASEEDAASICASDISFNGGSVMGMLELNRLRSQLSKAKKREEKLVNEKELLTVQLQKEMQDLEERLEASEEDRSDAKRLFRQAEAERERLEKLNSKMRDKISMMEARLEEEEALASERLRTGEASIDELVDDTQRQKGQIKDLMTQLKESQTAAQIAQENFKRAEMELAELNKDRSHEAEQEKARSEFLIAEGIREQLTPLQRQLDARIALVTKLETSLESTRAAHQKELEKIAAESAEAEGERQRVLNEQKGLREQAAETKRGMEEAQRALRIANEKFDAQLTRLNEQLADAENAVVHSERARDESVEEARRVSLSMEALREKLNMSERKLIELEAARSNKDVECVALKRELDGAEARRVMMAARVTELEVTVADAQKKMELEGTTNVERQVCVSRLELELHQARQEREKLSVEVKGRRDAEEALASMRETLAADAERIKSLEVLLAEIRQQHGITLAAEIERRRELEENLSTARESSAAAAVAAESKLSSEVQRRQSIEASLSEWMTKCKKAEDAMVGLREAHAAAKSAAQRDLVSEEEKRTVLEKSLVQAQREHKQHFAEEVERRRQAEQSLAALREASESTKLGTERDVTAEIERRMAAEAALLSAKEKLLEELKTEKEKHCVLENELESMRGTLSSLKREAADELEARKSAEASFEKDRALWEQARTALQDKLEHLEMRRTADAEEAKRREEGMWAQLNNMSSALAVRKQEPSEEGKSSSAALAQAERERDRAVRDATDIQAELQRTRERMAAKKQKAAAVREKLEGECESLKNQLREAEDKLKERLSQAEAAHAGECESLKYNLRQAEDKLKNQLSQAESSHNIECEKLRHQLREVSVTHGSEILALKQKLALAGGASAESIRATEERATAAERRLALIETERETLEGQLERARILSGRAEEEAEAAAIWQSRYEEEAKRRRELHERILDLQGNIRVICRLRPPNPAEMTKAEVEEWTKEVSFPDRDKIDFWGMPYQFERVFAPDSTQEQVFAEVQPTVASALSGHRVTIFAYGQTGSGKTHTMQGPRQDPGVNKRALSELFSLSSQEPGNCRFRVSMLEVYNESIIDLLVRGGSGPSARHEVRQDKQGRVYVEGLIESDVTSLEEVEGLMNLGAQNRTVGNNNINEHSSRSHLVLQISIKVTDAKSGKTRIGQLNLVDLAGSERIKVRRNWWQNME
jgi:hypothetical protein